MVTLKKALAAVLCTAMVMSLLAGCGNSDSGKTSESSKASGSSEQSSQASQTSTSESSSAQEASSGEAESTGITYPLDTDVELRVYIQGGMVRPDSYVEWEDVPFIKGLEERTGVSIKWESAPAGANASTSYNLLLQEKDLPQIIMGTVCSPANMEKRIEEGIAYDISDMLEEYAPDFWAFINNEEDPVRVRDRGMMMTKYGLTSVIGPRDVVDNNTWQGIIIRQDWLDELKLEIPETLEELDTVARAFHDKYGAVVTGTLSNFSGCRFAAGGVGAYAAFSYVYYVEDGEIKFANDKDEWKEYLTFMRKWYEDGILDPNFSGATKDSVFQMANTNESGLMAVASGNMTFLTEQAVQYNTGANWVGIPNIVLNKGDKMTKAAGANYSGWNGSVGSYITTNCTEEELKVALAFLNYGYTEEGAIYWNFGEEGVSFEYDAEGNPKYTDLILKHELGNTQSRREYCGTQNNATASYQMWDSVKQGYGQSMIDVTNTWLSNNDAMSCRTPTLVYDDDQATHKDLNNALSTYVSEMALKFVVGEESLDNWDKYIETLNSMGLETVLKIKNDAYQRYLELTGEK